MTMKKSIAISILLMAATIIHADTETVNGITWTYRITGDGAEIYGSGYPTYTPAISPLPTDAVTIPSMLSGRPVTSIGAYAFYNCSNFESVAIPTSVTRIGEKAFYGCSGLMGVTIPAGVMYIGERAFYGCLGITSVAIPDGVTRIEISAFEYCTNITNVTISCSVTNIRDYAFRHCNGLTAITVSADNPVYKSVDGLLLNKNGTTLIQGVNGDVIIPESVTNISQYAFCDCSGLTSVTIPDGVVYIEEGVFLGCSGLTSITIPDSVASIGMYAFQACIGLRSVKIPDSVTNIGHGAFAGCNESLYDTTRIPGVELLDGWVIKCKNDFVGDLSLGGVRGIGNWAFSHCYGLTGVTISDSVTSVGELAFDGCNGLTNVTIGSSVTSIGASAFYGCSRLTRVAIPNSVTNIGAYAFSNCGNLAEVVIPNSVTQVDASVFNGCGQLKNITLPTCVCNSTLAAVFPMLYRSFTNVTVDAGVSLVGDSLFAGCSDLTSVTMPSTVTRLGDSVFKDCSELKSVTFEGDAPDVGSNVYEGTPRSLVTYVNDGSIGWDGGISSELPEDWNGRRIAIAPESEGSGASGGESGGSCISVSLTVTNVVVHYVLNSIVPEIAVPVSGDTGFVTVVTEIKGGAVAVAESWATNYPSFTEKFGSDFSAALTTHSGKRDSQGNALMVWQDYVAGTDPTDENDVFKASITLVDGVPQVSYTPELPEAEKAKRKYTTYGKARLQDEEWSVVDGDADKYNFFKVTVEMR